MNQGLMHKARVLLVDTDPESSAGCAHTFAAHGLQIVSASTYAEACEALRGNEFDAIVTDLALGDDARRLMHLAQELSPGAALVLVTAEPTVETAISALENGATHYLVRPVAPQTVFQAVWSSLVRRERASDSQRRIVAAPCQETEKRALKKAIENLYMVFQPIVSWADHRIVAYEALVRTREPSLMRPDLLFAAAEKFEMVIPLGRAIRSAVARSIDDVAPGVNVFVNLHGAELADEELYSPTAPLSRVADRVVLEVTERWSLDCFHDVRERMQALRSMGFRVAVDDLGAGYAGLTSFARLRPEIVKIDMSLIRGIDQDPTRQHLVRSLNVLCTDLGIQVVAEGIETEGERDTLLSLGSDLLQGYLFSKPAPAFPDVQWGGAQTIPLHKRTEADSHRRSLDELRDALSGLAVALASGDRADALLVLELSRRTLQRLDSVLSVSAPVSARTPAHWFSASAPLVANG
jgi:EAL domain-containing protein (putative c-di-GMP-specific phosphodiesterase class I)